MRNDERPRLATYVLREIHLATHARRDKAPHEVLPQEGVVVGHVRDERVLGHRPHDRDERK